MRPAIRLSALQEGLHRKALPGAAFLALLGMALLHAVQILSISDHMMDSDEAAHTLPAIQMLAAASRYDFAEVWKLVIAPHWYPPLHSLLLAGWFSVFGIGLTAARLFALSSYVALGAVLWRFGSLRDESEDRWATALVIGALATDLMLRQVASLSMLEAPATLALFASLYLCAKAVGGHGKKWAFGASLCAFAALGIKYNYGLLAFVGVGSAAGWNVLAARNDRKELKKALLLSALLVGPFLALAAGWLVGFGHWQSLAAYSQAQSSRVELWSLENLTFYFKALTYGSPITVVCLFLVVLAASKAALDKERAPRRLDAATVGLGATFLLNFLVLTYKLQNSYRFSVALLPCVWVLAVRPLSRRVPSLSSKQTLLFASLLLGLAWAHPPSIAVQSADENRDTAVARAYEQVFRAAKLSKARRIYLLDRAEVRGGGRARAYSARGLAVYLYELCARERPLSACKFNVWDRGALSVRGQFAGGVLDEETTIRRADLAVRIRDDSRRKRKTPKWLSKWRTAGARETGEGLFVTIWKRPRKSN